MTPLQCASVELQAACGEYYTVADMEWLRGVLRRALAAERRRIRKAIRALMEPLQQGRCVEDSLQAHALGQALSAVRAEGRRGG